MFQAAGPGTAARIRIVSERRDPEDDKILACAKQADADYLVTGDQDLLIIDQYGRKRIVTPRNFENIFEG